MSNKFAHALFIFVSCSDFFRAGWIDPSTLIHPSARTWHLRSLAAIDMLIDLHVDETCPSEQGQRVH